MSYIYAVKVRHDNNFGFQMIFIKNFSLSMNSIFDQKNKNLF